jgi:hypothetical protein
MTDIVELEDSGSDASRSAAPSGVAHFETAALPSPIASKGRRRWWGFAAVGVIVAGGAFVAARGDDLGSASGAITVDGGALFKSGDALAAAETRLGADMAAADIKSDHVVSCWYSTLIPPEGDRRHDADSIVCGPVRFPGQTSRDVYVTGDFDLVSASEDPKQITATFSGFSGITPLPASDKYVLLRPDGRAAPDNGVPVAEAAADSNLVMTDTGHAIRNAQSVTSSGIQFLASLGTASRPATVQNNASCWFEATDGHVSSVTPTMICGPVLLSDGNPATAFVDVPIQLSPVNFWAVDALLSVSPEYAAEPRFVSPPSETLHPEGRAIATVEIALPDPPAQEAGFVTVLSSTDGVILAPPTQRGLVKTSTGTTVKVTGVAETNRVVDGDAILVPAAGEHFQVIQMEVDGGGIRSLTLEVDSARSTLNAPTQNQTLLVSVPDAAVAMNLAIEDGYITQRVDLRTGERLDPALATLYRATPTFAINQAGTASVSVERPNSGDENKPLVYKSDASFRINTLVLSQVHDLGERPAVAPDRKTYLIVHLDWSQNSSWYSRFSVQPGSFSITLQDGTILPEPTMAFDSANSQLQVAFLVDDTVSAGTLSFQYKTKYDIDNVYGARFGDASEPSVSTFAFDFGNSEPVD